MRLLGFDDRDAAYVSSVLEGMDQFRGRDARDRIAHLFRIRSTLSALFRDLEVENDWLREAHTLLDGRSPMDLLLGGSMEDLLLVSEYADAAAGRRAPRNNSEPARSANGVFQRAAIRNPESEGTLTVGHDPADQTQPSPERRREGRSGPRGSP